MGVWERVLGDSPLHTHTHTPRWLEANGKKGRMVQLSHTGQEQGHTLGRDHPAGPLMLACEICGLPPGVVSILSRTDLNLTEAGDSPRQGAVTKEAALQRALHSRERQRRESWPPGGRGSCQKWHCWPRVGLPDSASGGRGRDTLGDCRALPSSHPSLLPGLPAEGVQAQLRTQAELCLGSGCLSMPDWHLVM